MAKREFFFRKRPAGLRNNVFKMQTRSLKQKEEERNKPKPKKEKKRVPRRRGKART